MPHVQCMIKRINNNMQRKFQKTHVLQRDIKAVAPVYSASLFMKHTYTRIVHMYTRKIMTID